MPAGKLSRWCRSSPPLLDDIEAPHTHLHESAISIGEQYVSVDTALGSFLREKQTDHLAWKNDVSQLLIDLGYAGDDIIVDHAQCSLEQRLYADMSSPAGNATVPSTTPLHRATSRIGRSTRRR